MQILATLRHYARHIQHPGQFILLGLAIGTGILYFVTVFPSSESALSDHYYMNGNTLLLVIVSANSLTALVLLLLRLVQTSPQTEKSIFSTDEEEDELSITPAPFNLHEDILMTVEEEELLTRPLQALHPRFTLPTKTGSEYTGSPSGTYPMVPSFPQEDRETPRAVRIPSTQPIQTISSTQSVQTISTVSKKEMHEHKGQTIQRKVAPYQFRAPIRNREQLT